MTDNQTTTDSTTDNSNGSIESAAHARYFRGDTVVVKDTYAAAILVFRRGTVPDRVFEDDHYTVVAAPDNWTPPGGDHDD